MQQHDRVLVGVWFGVDEVAQQEFEAVHAIEEGEIEAAAEQLGQIVGREEIITGHLIELQHGLLAQDIELHAELGVNANTGRLDVTDTASGVDAHFEVALAAHALG